MAKIYRDDYGIPHIMATTSFDAAKAIAYVHSEDDFLYSAIVVFSHKV